MAAIGWYASYAYAKHRDDRIHRLNARLKYRERQIEELYGPLVSLMRQIGSVWSVREDLVRQGGDAMSENEKRLVWQYFWSAHFKPLHAEMRAILKQKLYLLEGSRLPESFLEYIQHSVQEEAKQDLMSKSGIDTTRVSVPRFPTAFAKDIGSTLESLLKAHNLAMQALLDENGVDTLQT